MIGGIRAQILFLGEALGRIWSRKDGHDIIARIHCCTCIPDISVHLIVCNHFEARNIAMVINVTRNRSYEYLFDLSRSVIKW